MKTNGNEGKGIVSYDILDLTPTEMQAIIKMRQKVGAVIFNHRPENGDKKKMYLDDNELKQIWAILTVLSEDVKSNATTAFDSLLDRHAENLTDFIEYQLKHS